MRGCFGPEKSVRYPFITMNDSEFDDLLRATRDDHTLSPNFHHEVWERIESADAVCPSGIAKFPPILAAMTRPWGAVGGIAAMITLGLWLGATTGPDVMDAKQAYAESISPFAQSHEK